MRRSGAPRAEPTAAMPEATLDPRHGPLDPRKVLTSIGEVVYDWDLASDALAWGANAAEVLGVADRARLASGAGFALMVDPQHAVGARRAAVGAGIPAAGVVDRRGAAALVAQDVARPVRHAGALGGGLAAQDRLVPGLPPPGSTMRAKPAPEASRARSATPSTSAAFAPQARASLARSQS